jgi:hypothetical protein
MPARHVVSSYCFVAAASAQLIIRIEEQGLIPERGYNVGSLNFNAFYRRSPTYASPTRAAAPSLEATFEFQSAALQQWLTVGVARRTHADCHEAAVRHGDRRWPERRLYEVLRS